MGGSSKKTPGNIILNKIKDSVSDGPPALKILKDDEPKKKLKTTETNTVKRKSLMQQEDMSL